MATSPWDLAQPGVAVGIGEIATLAVAIGGHVDLNPGRWPLRDSSASHEPAKLMGPSPLPSPLPPHLFGATVSLLSSAHICQHSWSCFKLLRQAMDWGFRLGLAQRRQRHPGQNCDDGR